MSLQHFQTALAYIIRVPEEDRLTDVKDIPLALLLSPLEKNTLDHFIKDRLVWAYGDDMLQARWRMIRFAIPSILLILEEEKIKNLWRNDFEKKYYKASFIDVNNQFVEYLANDSYAQECLLKDKPDYYLDVLKYLNAVYTFSKNTLSAFHKLKPGTLLRHGVFNIVTLQYDVREFCDELLDKKIMEFNAKKQPLNLLFFPDEIPAEFRCFEIDDELKNFFEIQTKNPAEKVNLPPCYDDLVEMGLFLPK